MTSNLTLAIDTSTSHGSVALGNGSVVVNRVQLNPGQKASQSLIRALTMLGIPRLRLKRIVVGLGPGSFSGIRVGIAAAYGIAQVQGCPVLGVSSTFSVGMQLHETGYFGLYADARRKELFCTEFELGDLVKETYLIPASDFEKHSAQFENVVSSEKLAGVSRVVPPRAEDLLLFPDDFAYWIKTDPLEPIYLREATFTKAKPISNGASLNVSLPMVTGPAHQPPVHLEVPHDNRPDLAMVKRKSAGEASAAV